jgi:hypothetical protein
MSLKIKALHGLSEPGKLNTEWMVVVNEGEAPFNAENCSITVAKAQARPRTVTTFKAGLVIKGGETCRLVTGSSGKKSHGEAPVEENVRNVYLFLKAPYLEKAGALVRLMNRQLEVGKAVFAPDAADGIGSESN